MTRKPSAHSKLADVVNASFSANAAGHLPGLGFPNGDGPPTPLIAHYLESTERISHDFAHTVGVFTTLPVKLKTFLGKSVTVSMQCEDGSAQYFNGIVASFSNLIIEASGIERHADLLAHGWKCRAWLLASQTRRFDDLLAADRRLLSHVEALAALGPAAHARRDDAVNAPLKAGRLRRRPARRSSTPFGTHLYINH